MRLYQRKIASRFLPLMASLPDASTGIKARKAMVQNCRLACVGNISLLMLRLNVPTSKGIVIWRRTAGCQFTIPAAAKAVLCGNLGLAPSPRLAACLRPVKVGLGLGDNVLRVTALETLSVITIHVPRQLQVSSAPGTCLELYHFACSVLPPQRIRIKPCVAYIFITRN